MYFKFSLSDVLRNLRAKKGKTIREVASEAGLSPTTLGKIENGETDPRVSSIRKLAKYYAVPEAELFKLIGDTQNDVEQNS